MNRHAPRQNGYTLVEMMIAVAVIALLASIAVPAAIRARNRSRAIDIANELRATGEAFQMYAQEKTVFPPSAAGFSTIPTGMSNYMPKKSTWTSSPPGGGWWYFWNFNPFSIWGYNVFIGVYNPNFTTETSQQIDAALDDGDPNTGQIRVLNGGSWILYGVN